jgi:protein-tyrosine phosphatase
MTFCSRSATIVLAYLLKRHKMKFQDAMKYVSQRRFIWPNRGFERQLQQYEKELEKELEKDLGNEDVKDLEKELVNK